MRREVSDVKDWWLKIFFRCELISTCTFLQKTKNFIFIFEIMIILQILEFMLERFNYCRPRQIFKNYCDSPVQLFFHYFNSALTYTLYTVRMWYLKSRYRHAGAMSKNREIKFKGITYRYKSFIQHKWW